MKTLFLVFGLFAASAFAQTSFNTSDSNIAWSGKPGGVGGNCGTTSLGGSSYTQCLLPSAQMDVLVTGTQAVLNYWATTTTDIVVTVDGTPTTPTLTTGSAQTLTLWTGLSDTSHILRIKAKGATATGFRLLATGFLTVTGSAPVLSTPAGMTNTGNIIASFPTFISTEGTMISGGGAGFAGYVASQNDATLIFRGTCTDVWLWRFGTGSWMRLGTDRDLGYSSYSEFTSVQSPLTNTYDLIHLNPSPLDGTAEHEYIIHFVTAPPGFANTVFCKGGGVNTTTPIRTRSLWSVYGDSRTATSVQPDSIGSPGWPHYISTKYDKAMFNNGIGSTLTFDTGSQTGAGQNPTHIAQIPTTVTLLIDMYGHNDLSSGVSLANYQAARLDMMNKYIARAPSAKIYVMDTPESSVANFTTTNVGLYFSNANSAQNLAIAAAISANPTASITHIVYPYYTGVINNTAGVDTVDGVHFNASGGVKIANFIIPFLAPPSASNCYFSGLFLGTIACQ